MVSRLEEATRGCRMHLTARNLLSASCYHRWRRRPPRGSSRRRFPHAPYYAAAEAFYLGEYRDAERTLRRETQRGVRAGQVRWIDSICYHAMLGEVLYHQGRNAEALANFDQACQVLLAYPNWLLQVKFQQPPRPRSEPGPPRSAVGTKRAAIRARPVFGNRAGAHRRCQYRRRTILQQGGVVRAPMFWRVNVVEVIRMSALAIRRRNELLGSARRARSDFEGAVRRASAAAIWRRPTIGRCMDRSAARA